ncbi:MAG: DNA recombination protein RmuC [Thermoanaerobaculia bacterium]
MPDHHSMLIISVGVVALLAGVAAGFLVAQGRAAAQMHRTAAERDMARQERARTDAAANQLRRELDSALQTRAAAQARAQHLEETREEMESAFVGLAQRAFGAVSEQLMQQSKNQIDGSLDTKKVEIEGLLKPLREMVDNYRGELQKSEHSRVEAYGGLQQQIQSLLVAQESTHREASRLANALQSPTVRGSWGESSLKRCVELAGMTEYCDFDVQQTFENDEGRRLRPDLIVRLPNKRVIAIDAKVPLSDYTLAANETDDVRRREHLQQHVRTVRRHIDSLAKREYQASIGDTLDFVVLFVPGEHFLSAALITDPTLFDIAAEKKIYLASPTVLLPLLRAVVAGWKAERTEENAKRMHDAGVELFNRFVVVMDHVTDVGDQLRKTVDNYNKAIRSIDTRLWPKAEELQRLAGSGKELGALEPIDAVPIESTKLRLHSQGEEPGDVVPLNR